MVVAKEKEQTEGAEDAAPLEKQDEVDDMAKRKLTEDELEKTNNGITRLEKELEELKESIEFNEKTIEFQKAQDEYQNFARPYMKKQKEAKDKKTMDYMNQDLLSKKDILDNLKDQVENGVEIKKG